MADCSFPLYDVGKVPNLLLRDLGALSPGVRITARDFDNGSILCRRFDFSRDQSLGVRKVMQIMADICRERDKVDGKWCDLPYLVAWVRI